jgi:hypothetical protein
MKHFTSEPEIGQRLKIAGALATMTILLFAADRFLPSFAVDSSLLRENERNVGLAVGRALDSLLVRYGIDRSAVSTWQVHSAERKFTRIEQRVFVSPEFVSLQFNHDLAELVAPLDLRIVGTERAKENIVTMHIVQSGLTIRSVTFLVK